MFFSASSSRRRANGSPPRRLGGRAGGAVEAAGAGCDRLSAPGPLQRSTSNRAAPFFKALRAITPRWISLVPSKIR